MPTGPMTDAERFRFDLQGFLVRPGALSAGEVAALDAATDVVGVAPPGPDLASQRFSDFLSVARRFRDLIDHPAVLDIVRETCGSHVRLDHAYGIVMATGTTGLSLHGGAATFDPAQYYVTSGPRIHTGLVAAQWALVDHPPGAGGFVCIPGSHKAAFSLPRDVDAELLVQVPLHAGDVVVFSEALIHGTQAWRAPYERRTLVYKYSPGSSAWSASPWTDELRAMCTPRQRLLLQPPSVGGHQPVTP